MAANINFTNQIAYGQIVGRTASTTNTGINGYLLYSVWGYRPVAGIHDDSYDLEQELVDEEAYEESGIFTINPVVNAKNIFRENNIKVLNTSGILESELFENLQLKITASYNNRMGKNSQFNNSKTLRGTPLRRNNTDGVNGEISHTEVADWTNENTLTWHKYLNGGHYLQAMGGFLFLEESIRTMD